MKRIMITQAKRKISQKLQEIEQKIANAFINAFLIIGLGLEEIRVSKAYKEEWKTFDQYCIKIWNLSKSQAYRFIKAAKIYNALEERNVGDKYPLPIAEGTLRPFEDNELTDDEMWNCWVETCNVDSGKKPTANTLYRVVSSFIERKNSASQNEELDEDTEKQKESCPSLRKIRKKYDLILADFPWEYDNGFKKSIYPGNQYDLMSTLEIADMGIESIAKPNCVLFCWVPSPKCAEAHDLIRQLGWEFKTMITWVKKTTTGIGRWVRSAPEHLFICTKGRTGLPDFSDTPAGYYCSKPEGHSVKPAIFHEIIEGLTKGYSDRIELFSRRTTRLGWDFWGNEVGYVIGKQKSPSRKVAKRGVKSKNEIPFRKAA